MAKFFLLLALCATSALADWKNEVLNEQNHYRARHGVSPMSHNKELSRLAQEWADKLAAECNAYHKQPGESLYNGQDTGENLFASSHEPDHSKAGKSAADSWYSEIKDYPYASGGFDGKDDDLFMKIGHFTQTVWKDTHEAGFGIAHNPACPEYQTYLVGRFFPPGNSAMEGEEQKAYSENVPPPK